MIKTAVILTVFNRREVTLKGLRSLYTAIDYLQKDQQEESLLFDVYMTDDGCTDGTGDAVRKEFPDVQIIKGNGNLYWGGGMRLAWQSAIDSGINYNYYLWFNDDAYLYEDALISLFKVNKDVVDDCIVTGAFCGHEGNASYGGKMEEDYVMEPNGSSQNVALMNGNLVLVPFGVYSKIGMIDKSFIHGLGDYDYGLRAQNNNILVLLTDKYVGICDRHDRDIPLFYLRKFSVVERFKILYNPQNNPYNYFIFYYRHIGLIKALRVFVGMNIYTLFPLLFHKPNK